MRHVDAYLSPQDILNLMRTSRAVQRQFYNFTQEEFDRLTSRFFGLAMTMDAWCQQSPLQKQLSRSQRLKKLLCVFVEVEAQAAILVAVRPRRLDARGLFVRRTVLGEVYCYALMDELAAKLLSSSSFDANRLHQRMQRRRISDQQTRARD
ncbi:hypothetical protein BCR37DRAFT_394041 [Protomyces lactucae-debilis]|uniref:Uncharacterized protein n=1 Tax=Protomyces lactucae-debilis TaxID=2754530 RepID=A0A1Y2F9H6_PROLT|nr:uncharacterized protein BCR37DRAFT_394041 [Protomyces lactucae-debilis]ORY79976.1 hypothetical protein BCR37DRAFT_394041 [Protomyces lactucae-debilis]